MEQPQKEYLKRIRALREDRDLTQREVAAALGVAQTTYSQYELGKRPITVDTLLLLCDYFQVSADDLLGRNLRK